MIINFLLSASILPLFHRIKSLPLVAIVCPPPHPQTLSCFPSFYYGSVAPFYGGVANVIGYGFVSCRKPFLAHQKNLLMPDHLMKAAHFLISIGIFCHQSLFEELYLSRLSV